MPRDNLRRVQFKFSFAGERRRGRRSLPFWILPFMKVGPVPVVRALPLARRAFRVGGPR